MDDSTISPVCQVNSGMDFHRHVMRTRTIFGLEILQIKPDKAFGPKIVIAKVYYNISPISEQLDEPFRKYALQYEDNIGHPDRVIPGKQTIKFLNVNAARVGGLEGIYNPARFPTLMILRNGVILVKLMIRSEKELDRFMAVCVHHVLQIPETDPDFPTVPFPYSDIEQLSPTSGPITRSIEVASCVYNTALHQIGSLIPDVDKFPTGVVGSTAKVVCYVVDAMFYCNNNSPETSRFLNRDRVAHFRYLKGSE